ncbi:MAG TPA: efflux RND transporter periplasmic adaptor subunit [Methylomusa anaerophila]|uniref:Multidrug resistance protein MdtN n=1 Tax=Methylomusa anaerophila TaxID=1930071 RepID=A0A348AIQ9_9FIRM|nr:efflux RND transporter periplasmic adaptor subunit [Methylomusa anaerophila]BBB90957.1 multidrug resistance protein MdtN [Methylomusa anaerophila]HML90416.1 efflux RND transporter periplasmic adaptor subunit [Methylomusa anaerophila]
MNKKINKKIIVAAIAVVVLAVLAVGGYRLYLPKEKSIKATGTVEVTLTDIVPKTNGYMSQLAIQVGDTVGAGQVVAHITRADLKAQLLADEAAHSKAQAQLADLEKGSRQQEIQQAEANVVSAQATYDKAKNDLERYRVLYRDNAISAQQFDTAQASYDVAHNTLLASQSQQSLVAEGNRPDVIEAQRNEVKRLQAVIEVTRAALADTVVASPLNGVVLTKNFENGEYLNAGSAIATIGDLNDCWVKIYVSSAELGLIEVSQPVDVHIDSYPNRVFAGTIKEISQNAEFTPRQSITQRERANLVFYVKVKIDNSEGILKPGMPADVVIQL